VFACLISAFAIIVNFKVGIKILGLVGAVGSFIWGVIVWRAAQKERQASATRDATKPFLEKQLLFYSEATAVASRIATLSDGVDRKKNIQRFWELYWGELAMVESKDVESAMVNLGRALIENPSDRGSLEQLSLRLADSCRHSLAKSWGTEAWVNPDPTERPATGQLKTSQ